MRPTRFFLQHRQPMIQFLGKRHTPQKVDHEPHVHPAAPAESLPTSFVEYRKNAQQYGPMASSQDRSPLTKRSRSSPEPQQQATPASSTTSSSEKRGSGIGDTPGRQLGPVAPPKGEYFDRDELPKRFHRTSWSTAEMEAIESGGATML